MRLLPSRGRICPTGRCNHSILLLRRSIIWQAHRQTTISECASWYEHPLAGQNNSEGVPMMIPTCSYILFTMNTVSRLLEIAINSLWLVKIDRYIEMLAVWCCAGEQSWLSLQAILRRSSDDHMSNSQATPRLLASSQIFSADFLSSINSPTIAVENNHKRTYERSGNLLRSCAQSTS